MVRACGVYTREIISSTLKKNSSKLVTKNIVLSFPYLILLERSVHKMVNPGMYTIADCTYTIRRISGKVFCQIFGLFVLIII